MQHTYGDYGFTAKLGVSASQFQAFERCDRLWWAQSVLKMPGMPRDYFSWGTIFDAVMRRWYAGDRLGRDSSGGPVDLFPNGWDTVDGFTLPPADAAHIKKLVEKGIELGVLTKEGFVGNGVKFLRDLIPDVQIAGEIDLYMDSGIEDFKTAKSGQYLKQDGPEGRVIDTPYLAGDGTSPNCVGHDTQMLTYACEWFKRPEGEASAVCKIQHKQFIKDPAEPRPVRTATAEVSRRRADQFWKYLQTLAAQMLALVDAKEDQWFKVPGPRRPSACSEYGGCGLRDICGRKESPGAYRARLARVIQKKNGSPAVANTSTIPQENKPMATNIFAKRNQAVPAQGPTPSAVLVQAPAPAAPAPVLATLTVAPWACAPNADGKSCGACLGTGINPQQQPCRICDSINAKLGKTTSSMFVLGHDADGKLFWEPKAGTVVSPTAPNAIVVPQSPIEDVHVAVGPEAIDETPGPAPVAPKRGRGRPRKNPAPAPVITVSDDGPTGNGQEIVVEGPDGPEVEAPTLGRPKIGFTLLVDCAYMHGPKRETVMLSEILAHFGQELADQQNVASFYALDPWKRRDALRQKALEIAEQLGTRIVLCFGADPDGKALADALAPLASMVIAGVK